MEIDKMFDESIVMEYMKSYEESQAKKDKFIKSKRYLDILEQVEEVNNDSIIWDDEMGYTFDFLYVNGQQLLGYTDEISIRYKDKVYTLFEMHGQGCFQSITTHDSRDEIIELEDIETYAKTGVKPQKYLALDLIDIAFKTLAAAHCSSNITVDGREFDMDEIINYIYGKILK